MMTALFTYQPGISLLLVGVVHQLADIAAENVSGASVAKVALTFCQYTCLNIGKELFD